MLREEGVKGKAAEKKYLKTLEKKAFDLSYLTEGKKYLAGIDEVGRGPLAGPVVCAAVIMPYDEENLIVGIDDSKKVTEKNRSILAEKI